MNSFFSKLWIVLTVIVLLITGTIILFSCSRSLPEEAPLTDFIYHASCLELPVSCLETINNRIKIQCRARPAYAGSIVYLTDSFDDEGLFIPFYKLDSFEISSVFHECFHAYVDLVIRQGKVSQKEARMFDEIMEDSLDYYTETADGRDILWKNYRMQASEEAMAMYITNLVKYRIVYEKNAQKAARNYIYGAINRSELEQELQIINSKWQDIIQGERSRGYYNKGFLRWKLPHIIDAKNYISEKEKAFVTRFILPDITGAIKNPPLTDFIKGCKTDDLPYDFLIEVNKDHFWDEEMVLEPYEDMSPERVSQVYVMALGIYWDSILKRDLGADMPRRDAFRSMLQSALKWYTGPINDQEKIEAIAKNAAAEYVKNIIYEKKRWQEHIKGDILDSGDPDSREFINSWTGAVEGRQVHGFYMDKGVVIRTSKPMTLEEKLFITVHILPDIGYAFAPIAVAEPVPAHGEIVAEGEVFSGLTEAVIP